jgi:hypothetical protein
MLRTLFQLRNLPFIKKVIIRLSKRGSIFIPTDLKLLPVALALSMLFVIPAHAQDPAQSYQREMDKAIAEIDKQSKIGSVITMPVLRPTGSAMYDKAAQVTLQFTVELRREMAKMGAWQEFISDNAGEDYSFLAKPDLVEKIYSQLEKWNIEQRRHLTAYESIVSKFKKGMRELHMQYGEKAEIFASPYVDDMAIRYPSSLNKLASNFGKLIEYARLNAGKIKPAPNGLVTMQTRAETMRLFALIKDFGEAADQFQHLADGQPG